MQVDRVPDIFLYNKNYSDIAFDKNGRFIYFTKKLNASTSIFIIYDIVFNDYIELTPDSSFTNTQTPFFDLGMYIFLPIDIEYQLFVVNIDTTTTSVLLVHLNKEQKIYGVLDEVVIPKCEHAQLLSDGNEFGLFFLATIDGEYSSIADNDNAQYAFLPFAIEDNQIKLKAKINFNYEPFSSLCEPQELYLRKNKLWFIRLTDIEFRPASHPRYPQPPQPHQDENLRISYFDLREDSPSEICVGEIELNHLENPEITNLKWVQDSLLLQIASSKFDIFDLVQCEWSREAIDCGETFLGFDEKEGWFEYECTNHWRFLWYSQTFIDDQFVLTAVKRKTKKLHRIPLKNPFQLRDIAWTAALNAGFFNLDSKICLPPNLPYARVL